VIRWQLWFLSPKIFYFHSISESLQKIWGPSSGPIWENSPLKWFSTLQGYILWEKRTYQPTNLYWTTTTCKTLWWVLCRVFKVKNYISLYIVLVSVFNESYTQVYKNKIRGKTLTSLGAQKWSFLHGLLGKTLKEASKYGLV
jgi:hypothetical protein